MINLKTFCLLITLFSTFAIFSAAQQKPVPQPTPQTNPQAKRFESKEGNFSINIFKAPTEVRNLASEAAQKKRIDVGNQFFWQFEKTVYTVMYSNPLSADGAAMPLNLNDMNSGSRKGIANIVGAKLLSEKNITFGKYQGTEFRTLMPNGVKYIARNFLIGKMGYLITGGYVDDKDEKEVLAVLDSFKILVENK